MSAEQRQHVFLIGVCWMLCLAFVASVTSTNAAAFVSQSSRSVGSSSFVARRTLPQQQPTVYHPTTRESTTTSALSMNIFDRFTRVAKANINNVLKNLEDPEKIMNQAVEDMQSDLVKVRQSYAEITATQRRLMKQKEQYDAVAADWYQRAQLALQKGNEELAREALNRRQQQLDQGATIQSQIDAQAASIDKLYEGMQVLEQKILESKAKKEEMVARARTAKSTQQVNDMLGGITGKTSMDAFARMEDKVEALEAAAEVSAEMGSMADGKALPGSAGATLEQQFKMLEGSAAVDDELSKLKANLLTGSSSTDSGSSGSSTAGSAKTSSGGGNPKVDDDLEQLKRDAGL